MSNELIPKAKKKYKKTQRKDERDIREILIPLQFTYSMKEMAYICSEKMGKSVTASRVSMILHKMKDEKKDDFNRVFTSSREAAYESYMTYKRLVEEGWKLVDEALKIEDLVKKAAREDNDPNQYRVELKAKEKSNNLKILGWDKIRMGQEAIDKLMKMAGVHRESAPIGDEDSVNNMVQAMTIYLKHVVKCTECGHEGSDVQQFIDFIETVGKDPGALDAYVSSHMKYNNIDKKYYEEASQILDAEAMDVE